MWPLEDEIFGIPVGSTEPLFLTILAIHVAVALVAVVTGVVAMVSRKGSPRHTRGGRLYFYAICAVFATATGLALLRWSETYYLFFIGAVAFTASLIGVLHRKRHRPGDTPHIIGMGVSYIALLTGFYVDNGPNLPLWELLPSWAFWVLPTAVGAPIIDIATVRWAGRRRQEGDAEADNHGGEWRDED